jgi:hypothetical protein
LSAIHSTRRQPSARSSDTSRWRPDRRPLALQTRQRRVLPFMALVWLLCLSGPAGFAEASSKEQMLSLDEQVQEIKSDVLSIAAELSRLEEKLLYPSNTQVAVFVSVAEGGAFRLDSMQIQIDGELVAHHIYSFKELEALQKGGVQRIYTGNVRTGEHQIEVSVAGKLPNGNDVNGIESFSFSKQVEPKLVGITVAAGDSGGIGIQLGGL